MSSPMVQRLAEALKEMENPTKDNTAQVKTKSGGTYSYNFENLSSVLSIVKPALFRHDLALIQGVDTIMVGDAKVYYILKTGVVDTTGEHERLELDRRPLFFGDDPQANGSAETYARRYAIKTAFGLVSEDDDGQAAKDRADTRRGRGAVMPSTGAILAPAVPYPPQDRFACLRSQRARCELLGVNITELAKDLAGVTGKADMREYSDDDIRKAEQYLDGVIKNLGRA